MNISPLSFIATPSFFSYVRCGSQILEVADLSILVWANTWSMCALLFECMSTLFETDTPEKSRSLTS
jgi:hypothetical protein